MRSICMVLVAVLLGVSACTQLTSVETSKEDVVRSMSYIKDDRTGLCFSVVGSVSYPGWHVISHTSVPCEKVSHLLAK